MSSCVDNSPSPFNSSSAINTRPHTTLYSLEPEDSFDQASFPFLDSDHGMDYYIASTPESSANFHEDLNISMARPPSPIPHHPSLSHLGQLGKSERNHEDVPMGATAEGELSSRSLSNIKPSIYISDAYTMPQTHEPAPYTSMYGYTAMAVHEAPIHQHPAHFHPYRYDGWRPPRYAYSPPDPASPPLSMSPPGSAGSHHHALSDSPPQAVSPTIVSPLSAVGSMSDGSPNSGIWAYNLPHATGSVGSLPPLGTPLNSITSLPNISGSPPGPPGGMLRMVSGMPYHALPIGLVKDAGRSTRPKPSKRQSTGRPVTKKEAEKENEEESEGEEELDLDDEPMPPRGKSIFTPEEIRGPNLTEEVRKARIKSEQRRRDELREGFKRLREALPNSNQRPSKSSILDRSVAHIQQLTAASHWYQNNLERANQELASLRAKNDELVSMLAAHTRLAQASGSSPGS